MILAGCIRSELLVQSFRTWFNIVGDMFTYFIAICQPSAFYLTALRCKSKIVFLERNLLVCLHHHNLFKV